MEHLVFAAHLSGFCFPCMQSYVFALVKVRAQKCVLQLKMPLFQYGELWLIKSKREGRLDFSYSQHTLFDKWVLTTDDSISFSLSDKEILAAILSAHLSMINLKTHVPPSWTNTFQLFGDFFNLTVKPLYICLFLLL